MQVGDLTLTRAAIHIGTQRSRHRRPLHPPASAGCILSACVLLCLMASAASRPTHSTRVAQPAWEQRWSSYLAMHSMQLQQFETYGWQGGNARLLLLDFVEAGWGNRLASVPAAMLLALLTNRTLLMKTTHLDGHGGTPSMLYPPQFMFTPRHAELLSNVTNSELWNTGTWPLFLKENLQERSVGGPTVIEYCTSDYDVPLLRANKHLEAFFSTFFPDGEVFLHTFHRVMRPAPAVMAIVHEVLASKLPGSFTVGIQIRTRKHFHETVGSPVPQTFFAAAMATARSQGYAGEQVR